MTDARTETKRLVALVRYVQRRDKTTIRQACLRAAVDPSYFGKLEAGEKTAGITQLRKTADALRVAIDWFHDRTPPDAAFAPASPPQSDAMRAHLAELRAGGRTISAAAEARALAIADREGVSTSVGAMRCLDLARELVGEG